MIYAFNSPISASLPHSAWLLTQYRTIFTNPVAWDPRYGITLGGTMLGTGTSPPTVSILNAPAVPTGLWIDVQVGGARGAATFKFSTNDGSSYGATLTTAATVNLGNGFVLGFANNTYNANNLYKATVSAHKDLSGTYTLANSTAGQQPIYSSVVWAGLPALIYDHARDTHLYSTEAGLVAPYQGNDPNTVIAIATQDDLLQYRSIGLYGASANHFVDYEPYSATSYFQRSLQFISWTGTTTLQHLVMKNVGTAGTVYRNNVSVSSGILDAASLTLTHFNVGSALNSGTLTPLSPWTGKMGPIVLAQTCPDMTAPGTLWTAEGYDHYRYPESCIQDGTIVLMYDATRNYTLNGSNCSALTPVIGGTAADVLVQANPALQLPWGASAKLGGRNAVSNTGTRWMQSTTPASALSVAQTYTMIWIGVPTEPSGSDTLIMVDGASAAGDCRLAKVFAGNFWALYGGGTYIATGISPDSSLGAIVSAQFSDATSAIRVRKNGGTLGQETCYSSPGNSALKGVTLFANYVSSQNANGSVTVLMIVTGLSAADIQRLEQWSQLPVAIGGCGFSGWTP